jgi:hypothetical protein
VRVLGIVPRRGQIATMNAKVGEEVNIFGSAHDEGLPRGKTFVAGWKMLKGPATIKFSNQDAARTKAWFSAPGTYELELVASDGELTSSTRLNIVVSSA